MKTRETNNGVSKKASAGGRKDGNGKVGEFSVLPKSAGLKQSVAYVLLHMVAITRSMRVDLGSSWCLGYELTRIKAKLGLKGKDWDDHCVKVVRKTSRQVRDYMVLAKAYGSAEEMIKQVGETVSFANAVVTARALYPDPNPAHKPGKKGAGDENASNAVFEASNAAFDPICLTIAPRRSSGYRSIQENPVMARFPSKEAEVFALAQEMLSGLSANAAVYPSPPVTVAELATAFSAYLSAKNAAVAAQAAAEQATATEGRCTSNAHRRHEGRPALRREHGQLR